jgi:hypothetical protein
MLQLVVDRRRKTSAHHEDKLKHIGHRNNQLNISITFSMVLARMSTSSFVL